PARPVQLRSFSRLREKVPGGRMRGRAQRAALALILARATATTKIKGFRAVTARATFLCLCKETWRKETHPACAPGAAHRVRGAGGIFRGGILPPRKTPHIHVRRPCGVLSAASAAPEGPRRSRSTATATAPSL